MTSFIFVGHLASEVALCVRRVAPFVVGHLASLVAAWWSPGRYGLGFVQWTAWVAPPFLSQSLREGLDAVRPPAVSAAPG
jgi:hypothetical protein